MAKSSAPAETYQNTACSSEVPLHLLRRLADRRGQFGIGFTKEFMIARGAGPIFYACQGTQHANALLRRAQEKTDIFDPIFNVTPFVDMPGTYGGRHYNFEWEREWRHRGHFRFRPEDVAFLIIPEHLHQRAWGFFETAQTENTGPVYFCPYIDPLWGLDRVRAAFPAAQW
jgi:hypothetical protein